MKKLFIVFTILIGGLVVVRFLKPKKTKNFAALPKSKFGLPKFGVPIYKKNRKK